MRVFPKAIVLTTKSHFHVKRTYASIRGLVVRTITSGKTRISAIATGLCIKTKSDGYEAVTSTQFSFLILFQNNFSTLFHHLFEGDIFNNDSMYIQKPSILLTEVLCHQIETHLCLIALITQGNADQYSNAFTILKQRYFIADIFKDSNAVHELRMRAAIFVYKTKKMVEITIAGGHVSASHACIII